MRALVGNADRLLRGEPFPPGSRTLVYLVAYVIACGSLYGGVMGTFGGLGGERLWQVLYSALKVPLLLGVSFLLALPSFFVLNTLLGVRRDFPEAVRAVLASQGGLAIILVSLAPFTLLWYASSADYWSATLFNGLMFAVASLTAQRILARGYAPLVRRHRAHRWLCRVWIVLYVFVAIQMAWVLRPFIGDPELPTQFFRQESWGNAYVVIGQGLWRTLWGR
jgi:hypothetical protein